MPIPRLPLAALLLVLSPALACTPKPVDQKAAEAEVAKLMLEKNKLVLKTVSCPANQPGKAGTTFVCAGTDELGTTANFTVIVGENLFQVTPEQGLYTQSMKVIGDDAEARVSAKVGKVDVTCPDKIVIAKKGVKLPPCDMAIAGGTAKITFMFANDQGQTTFEVTPVAPPPGAAPAAEGAHAPAHETHDTKPAE